MEQQAKAKPLTPEEREQALEFARFVESPSPRGEMSPIALLRLARFALAEYEGRKEAAGALSALVESIVDVCEGHHDGTCDGAKCLDALVADRDFWKGKAEAARKLFKAVCAGLDGMEAERDSYKARAEEAERDAREIAINHANTADILDRYEAEIARLRGVVEEMAHQLESAIAYVRWLGRPGGMQVGPPAFSPIRAQSVAKAGRALAPPTEAAPPGVRVLKACPLCGLHPLGRVCACGAVVNPAPSPNGVIE